MFNSPYAKSGNFQGGANSGNMNPFGPSQNSGQAPMTGNPESPYVKPVYANGTGLNEGGGGTQQGGGWNPYGFSGLVGMGGNSAYNGPVGGGFQQQKPPEAGGPLTPTVNPGQPGDAGTQAPQVNAPNRGYSPPRLPNGPVIPRFMYQGNPSGTQRADWWAANRPRPFGNRPVAPNPPPELPPTDPYEGPPIIPPYPEY